MGYIAVFLRPGHSEELDITPSTAGVDMAVQIHSEDGKSVTFIIEAHKELRPTPRYIPPDHKIAQALVGRRIGDEIRLPDGTAATITSIKPKVLHALHELLENFQNMFPEAQGLERVRIDTAAPSAFEPLFERVRQRHEMVESVGNMYDSGAIPIALAARSLGLDPVDTFIGLSSTGHAIRVCQGTHPEREAAFAAIEANAARGCVLDAITLHAIRRLDMAEAIEAIRGPVAVVNLGRLA